MTHFIYFVTSLFLASFANVALAATASASPPPTSTRQQCGGFRQSMQLKLRCEDIFSNMIQAMPHVPGSKYVSMTPTCLVAVWPAIGTPVKFLALLSSAHRLQTWHLHRAQVLRRYRWNQMRWQMHPRSKGILRSSKRRHGLWWCLCASSRKETTISIEALNWSREACFKAVQRLL
jgi:hypothetical protein